jgi:hypothetical protein
MRGVAKAKAIQVLLGLTVPARCGAVLLMIAIAVVIAPISLPCGGRAIAEPMVGEV